MPTGTLTGALSSSDATILEAALEADVDVSGALTDQPDLIGDLTTAIRMVAALAAAATISASFFSADPAASLLPTVSVTAALTTSIRMAAALEVSASIRADLGFIASGSWESVARPGAPPSREMGASANAASITASRNRTTPRMVQA